MRVRQFQVHGAWIPDTNVKQTATILCDVLEQVERWQQQHTSANTPTRMLIHCR